MGVRRFAEKVDMPAISESMGETVPEWYVDAEIEIVNPDINGGEYDRATNTKTRNPQVLWTGKARIQAVRWPSVATARQAAMSLREVTFHIGKNDETVPLFIAQGWRVQVLTCTLSPNLEGKLYVVNTAINSSYDWDIRIEATMDQGVAGVS